MDCRYYDKQLPEIEDVVLVQVKSLSDIGAYVSLLEYGKLEGMIQISEMSNRRIRSISKLTRVGNIEVCLVLRVDADRGYIDLSKKRVHAEDEVKSKDAFGKAKLVHGIMRHIATICGKDLASVCQLISWPLYKTLGPLKAYDTLRRMVHEQNVELVLSVCEELRGQQQMIDALVQAAGRKLTPHEVRVRAVFELQSFGPEGISAIKEAVAEVKTEGLIIRVISAPQFLVETSGIGKELCVGRIEEALGKLKSEIEKRGGVYRLRAAPDVIGEDEEELPKLNDQDVSSDEDEDDNDVESGSDDSDSSDDESSESESSSSEDEKKKKKKTKGRK
jgi:translation initiation factor 2 subunit 1